MTIDIRINPALATITKLLSTTDRDSQSFQTQFEKQLLPLLAIVDSQHLAERKSLLVELAQSIDRASSQITLSQKTVVGFGGGFSAGKSRFINTLLGVDLLPEALEPCTAIATYMLPSNRNQIQALNLFNHSVTLDEGELRALSHLFDSSAANTTSHEPINLGQLIQHIVIQRANLPYSHLAFLDTPGYSKADSQHHQHSDEQLALNQLNQVDHLVWLISAKNGTIRDEDIQFIQSLSLHQPIFFVVTQSDLVNRSELDSILDGIKQTLERKGILMAGLMAWAAPISSNNGERLAGDDIQAWLKSVDQPVVHGFDERLEELIQTALLAGVAELANIHRNMRMLVLLTKATQIDKSHRNQLKISLQQQQTASQRLLQSIFSLRILKNQLIQRLGIEFLVNSAPVVDSGNIKSLVIQNDRALLVELQKVADESKCKEIQYYYGLALAELSDNNNATIYIGRAAKQGHKLAYSWIKKTAEQGNEYARLEFLELYDAGLTESHDVDKVFHYYYLFAKDNKFDTIKKLQTIVETKGAAKAKYVLATLYYFGYGVQLDKAKAFDLYQQSSVPESMHNDAAMLFNGEQVKKDRKTALNYWRKTSSSLKESETALERCGSLLGRFGGYRAEVIDFYDKKDLVVSVRKWEILAWCAIIIFFITAVFWFSKHIPHKDDFNGTSQSNIYAEQPLKESSTEAVIVKDNAVTPVKLTSDDSSQPVTGCSKNYYQGESPNFTNYSLAKRTQELCLDGFTVMYSSITRTPLWSAEHLTRDRLERAMTIDQQNNFHEETQLQYEDRATLADYEGSGFDRGRMSPNGDMGSRAQQYNSLSLANIIPLNSYLNQNHWRLLEEVIRELVKQEGEAYVISGAAFRGASIRKIGNVLVPSDVYKVVYFPSRKAAGVYFSPNDASGEINVISLAELNAQTGLDLLPSLPDSIKQQRIEMPLSTKFFNLSRSYR